MILILFNEKLRKMRTATEIYHTLAIIFLNQDPSVMLFQKRKPAPYIDREEKEMKFF